MYADFVAKIRISKVYSNEGDEEIYKSDIEILEKFKGKNLSSVYVNGRSDNKIGSSCAIFIPENTELIAYAYQDKNGRYRMGMCSGLVYYNNRPYINTNKIANEEAILSTLKKHPVEISKHIRLDTDGQIYHSLKQFKGLNLSRDFALFKLTFTSEAKVKNIELLSGFDTELDKKLIHILKSIEWRGFKNHKQGNVPEGTRFLYGIYYYKQEGDNPSFLSQFNH